MKTLLWIGIGLTAIGFAAFALGNRIEPVTDRVWTVELAAGCYLGYHEDPVNVIALACPHVDYIKLWPLPVEQPWVEPGDEPVESVPSLIASLSGRQV